MREIKFRGKSILTGEWVYGSLLQSEIPANGFCKTAICERFADPKTVGQYTGLRDKNKEIYEGDVVEFCANYSAKPCGWMSGVVLFENLQWGLKNEHGTYSIYDETDEFEGYKSEVIGNIYESNPLQVE